MEVKQIKKKLRTQSERRHNSGMYYHFFVHVLTYPCTTHSTLIQRYTPLPRDPNSTQSKLSSPNVGAWTTSTRTPTRTHTRHTHNIPQKWQPWIDKLRRVRVRNDNRKTLSIHLHRPSNTGDPLPTSTTQWNATRTSMRRRLLPLPNQLVPYDAQTKTAKREGKKEEKQKWDGRAQITDRRKGSVAPWGGEVKGISGLCARKSCTKKKKILYQ